MLLLIAVSLTFMLIIKLPITNESRENQKCHGTRKTTFSDKLVRFSCFLELLPIKPQWINARTPLSLIIISSPNPRTKGVLRRCSRFNVTKMCFNVRLGIISLSRTVLQSSTNFYVIRHSVKFSFCRDSFQNVTSISLKSGRGGSEWFPLQHFALPGSENIIISYGIWVSLRY